MKKTLTQEQQLFYPDMQEAVCNKRTYAFGRHVEVTIITGREANMWYVGYKLWVRYRGKVVLRRELPVNRKYGEFMTEKQALEYRLNYLLDVLYQYRNMILDSDNEYKDGIAYSIKSVADTLQAIKGIQLTVFK